MSSHIKMRLAGYPISANISQNNDHPLVSVVLPTYNGSKFLSESIESVLGQTYRQWELIIVDDGSTDNTRQILSHYVGEDSRILVIRNEKNMRLPASLNIGFSAARGELFTWTSDDNCYREHAFERMVHTLINNVGYHVVYSDFSIMDVTGKMVRRVRVPGFERLRIENCIGGCFMYTKLVHDTLGGYDGSQLLVEDYDFWLRASARFRLFPLNEDLYLFRIHDGSLTVTCQDDILRARYELLRKSLPRLSWMTEKQKRDALVRNESCSTWRHYKGEDYQQACYSALSLLRHYPVSIYPWYLCFRILPISFVMALSKVIVSGHLQAGGGDSEDDKVIRKRSCTR